MAQAFIDIEVIKQTISNNKNILSKDSRKKSEICSNLLKSLLNWDTEHYNDYYFELTSIYSKIELANQREALLNKYSCSTMVICYRKQNRSTWRQ